VNQRFERAVVARLRGSRRIRDVSPERAKAWAETISRLPTYLERLRASPVYGRGPGREPPPKSFGVYLFTENGEDLYVGRCGLTERARLAGKPGSSNFRSRLAGHTRPSSGHNSATFAWRLTIEALSGGLDAMPPTRAERQLDEMFKQEYLKQKERVTAMDFRVVEILDDFDSYVFEPYAALMLATPYNSWATS
jgi:hypothetical protein